VTNASYQISVGGEDTKEPRSEADFKDARAKHDAKLLAIAGLLILAIGAVLLLVFR
jgi:hypothetical protein